MYINRRKLRARLGSRKNRRANTKTAVNLAVKELSGKGKAGGASKRNHLSRPRRQMPKPSVLLETLVRKYQRLEAAKTAA